MPLKSCILTAKVQNAVHKEWCPVSVESKCQSFNEVDAGRNTPVSQQSVTGM